MTFDLERARGLRDFLQDDCAEVGDVWGEMIAEIERLRGFETAARDLSNDLTRVAKERDELQEANTNFAFQASDQAQEIGRLRAENAWLKSDREFQSEEQAARIEELEEAKLRSWQITEERKAALAAMSNLSETISCPDCGVWIGFADIGPHMAVLRAMLREAE